MSGGPYLSANGHRCTSVNASFPYYGIPVVDVTIADAVTLTNPVALTIGNLTLRCALALDPNGNERQRPFAGSSQARLVGGYGGWQRTVSLPPLANPSGIMRSVALADVALATGADATTRERINSPKALDGTIGPFWVPPVVVTAGALLSALAGPLWWVDLAGVTQIASVRPTVAIATPASVEELGGASGWVRVATEDPAAWMPGATYKSATVPQPLTVSASRIHAGADGDLRIEVLWR